MIEIKIEEEGTQTSVNLNIRVSDKKNVGIPDGSDPSKIA